MKTTKLSVILIAVLLFLTACKSAPVVVNENDILAIEFKQHDEVIVDTERIVIATERDEVQFIESPDEKFIIKENDHTNNYTLNKRYSYDILVPTDQIKEISRQYTEAFNQTLPIGLIKSEE